MRCELALSGGACPAGPRAEQARPLNWRLLDKPRQVA
jgi:hypothetical protein